MAMEATSALRSAATARTVDRAPGTEASTASALRQPEMRTSQPVDAAEIATTPITSSMRLPGYRPMAAMASGVTAAPMAAPEISMAASASAFGMGTAQPVRPQSVAAMAAPDSHAAGTPSQWKMSPPSAAIRIWARWAKTRRMRLCSMDVLSPCVKCRCCAVAMR